MGLPFLRIIKFLYTPSPRRCPLCIFLQLYVGVDEKMERWKQKVIELRKQKLAADGAV
jgi:hypothetical protein